MASEDVAIFNHSLFFEFQVTVEAFVLVVVQMEKKLAERRVHEEKAHKVVAKLSTETIDEATLNKLVGFFSRQSRTALPNSGVFVSSQQGETHRAISLRGDCGGAVLVKTLRIRVVFS